MTQDTLRPAVFRLAAPGLDVGMTLMAPRGIVEMLHFVLAGWAFQELKNADPAPDIVVSGAERLEVNAPRYRSERPHSDLVAVLNDLLVAVAYEVHSRVPDTELVHGAGFEKHGKTQVVFGARKAGKSILIAREAAMGAKIFADDLLLWRQRHFDFISMGIAPRLRRPILPDILDALGTKAFLPGQHTCYIVADAIDLASAGEVLRPDIICELQSDHTLNSISCWKSGKIISSHRIQ